MAKHKCPQCKKRFDYEMHGWICPECGFVITDDAEQIVRVEESLEKLQKTQPEARTSQPRSISRSAVQKQRKSSVGSILGKAIYRLICTILLMLVLGLGIAIAVAVPDMVESIRKNSDTENPDVLTAEMNEAIRTEEFSIRITEAFFPEWEEVTAPEYGRYLAVRYETRGENEEDFFQNASDVAWACLYDKTACTYLMPLYTTEMTDNDDVYSMLYGKGVIYDLSRNEGILVFLVTEPASEYDLYVVTGEENGYGQTDVLAETCYQIPLTLTEEGKGDAS